MFKRKMRAKGDGQIELEHVHVSMRDNFEFILELR